VRWMAAPARSCRRQPGLAVTILRDLEKSDEWRVTSFGVGNDPVHPALLRKSAGCFTRLTFLRRRLHCPVSSFSSSCLPR
jgi:hypothetical protein